MAHLEVAWSMSPAPGETACGDRVAAWLAPDAGAPGWLAVVDGLGHGPQAAEAAERALQCIGACHAAHACEAQPLALMARLDVALKDSRGGAIGLAWWTGTGLLHTGIGNTRCLRWRDGQVQRLASRYGIVGDGRLAQQGPHEADAVHGAVQPLALLPGDWLLLFTDGLDEQLRLSAILPAWQRQPSLLCDHLMARWRVPRDDAAVMVCRVCT